MPIRMVDDPNDPQDNSGEDSGGSGGGGNWGGGGNGLLGLLPLILGLFRGRGLILVLVLLVGGYFFLGRGGCNSLIGGGGAGNGGNNPNNPNNQNGLFTGGYLGILLWVGTNRGRLAAAGNDVLPTALGAGASLLLLLAALWLERSCRIPKGPDDEDQPPPER